MTINRINPRKGYTKIANSTLQGGCPGLNNCEFRVLLYLLSHSDDFEMKEARIEKALNISIGTVKNAVKKLKAYNYLKLHPKHKENGDLYYEWEVWESPKHD